DRIGAGSLVIDSKKLWAIKHWMEQTCDAAREEVMISLKDNAFAFGPWGESLSIMKHLFMKSTISNLQCSTSSLSPLEGESTIPLDWTLPMWSHAQTMLFRRIRLHFEKATAIVEDAQDRRKYRMSESDLLSLRNVLCLWAQVRDFLSTRLPNFTSLEEALMKGNGADHELEQILQQRPAVFAVSFLPCAQQSALEDVKKHEEVVTLEAQKQRLELRDAKWKYFAAALNRDQQVLRMILSAPAKLEALKHRKQMAWRIEQAQVGERVVKSYLEKFLRCDVVEKMEHGQLKVNEYRSFVAATCNCKESDVHILTFVDLNVPLAKSKERMEELCTLVQFANDLQPTRNVGVIEVPEAPKKTSKRGLADEESDLQQTLWGLRQACDNRWFVPFEIQASADAQTARRRFSFGRLVVNKEAESDNPWINNSEFGSAGRPLGTDPIILPLSKDLILPEALDPDSDLRFAERLRPSSEATSAQKGCQRWEAILKSMLTMTGYSLKKSPVIVLNLTSYVEDLGVSAFRLRESKQELKGGFHTDLLFYQSVWWLNKDGFGAARLAREVTDAWIAGKLEHAGQKINVDIPALTNDEISSIPGAAASLSRLDTVQFEVLERIGSSMNIKNDEHRFWMAQGGTITDEYCALREAHLDLIGRENQLVEAQPENTESEAATTATTMESLEKLEASHGVEHKVASEIPQVEIILAKDGSLWLMSSQDRSIPKHSQLGGFGTGQYVPAEGEEGIDFHLPEGDRSLVQLDEASFKADGSGVSVITFFKMLVLAEQQKHLTQHLVSYMNVTRKADSSLETGMDGFEITYKSKMRFKCLVQEKVTCKNIFAKMVGKINEMGQLQSIFRFRYERIGASFKVQRPYVITKARISLKRGQPQQIK
ncbi:Uncharacterized protein SCF082_LOCUS44871, partial [Durusdinium trenchii]